MCRRKISLILALVIALGTLALTGCKNSTQKSSKEVGNKEFDVTTVRWSDWGEKYHEGFPDEAAKEAGIKVNWESVLSSDWGDKKAVLLAGGDLPDAFMGRICFSESDIIENAGTFIALEDYIDENMPNFKKIMESDPMMKAMATSSDGHIYGLPSKLPCRPIVANQMFINQTWLDNLGLSMPTTYLEFENVLRAFKEQDANGNGDPNDEIPFAQGYTDTVMFFCLPFGTNMGANDTYFMALKDGKPAFIPTLDNYKDGIAWMHHCYKEGLIDQEIFTEDNSMRDAKLMSETPIVGVAAGWTPDALFGPNADQYVAMTPLTGPDGNAYISSDPDHWNCSRYEFVITSSCKDPGALLAWADKFYTEDASIQNFYGSFGIGTKKDDAGNYTVLAPQDGNSPDTNAWIYSLRDFGPKYVKDGFNDKVSFAVTDSGDGLKLSLDKGMKQYAREAYPNVSFTTEQLKTLSTLYTDIVTYVQSMQTTWVAEGGVEEQWDTYMETLKQMGYDDFMKIMNDAYENYMSSK